MIKNGSLLVTVVILLTLVLAGVGLTLHPGDYSSWSSYVDPWLYNITRFSVYQAFLSAMGSILVAIPFAWILSLRPFKAQWMIKGLLNLFFIMPVLTIILGVVSAFSDWMNVFSLKGILIAHFYLNVPFAIRVLWDRLGRVSQGKRQLGQLLNFSLRHQFVWIDWPVLFQAIKPTFVVIFLLCFSSFTVVLTLGGGPANTNLEVAIYQALKFDFDPRAGALYAAIHGIIAFSVMWFLGRRSSYGIEFEPKTPHRLRFASPMQIIAILVLLSMLFYPLLALLGNAFSEPWTGSARFVQGLTTSLILALASGAFALMLALFRSFSTHNNRLIRFLDFGLMVLPIMVVSTGLFLLALKFNLAFKVTGLLIIWLNGLMAMPLVLAPLASRVTSYRKRYEKLVSLLGMSDWQQWRFIYWPALKDILPWSFTLALVLSVGDLGVAALIGSAQFVTLPILIYQAMGSYQMVLASQLTVILLMICTILLVVAEWMSERGRHAGR